MQSSSDWLRAETQDQATCCSAASAKTGQTRELRNPGRFGHRDHISYTTTGCLLVGPSHVSRRHSNCSPAFKAIIFFYLHSFDNWLRSASLIIALRAHIRRHVSIHAHTQTHTNTPRHTAADCAVQGAASKHHFSRPPLCSVTSPPAKRATVELVLFYSLIVFPPGDYCRAICAEPRQWENRRGRLGVTLFYLSALICLL